MTAIQKAREALRAIIDTLDAEEMGEGPPASEHVAHWQKLHDDGTAALAALDAETPATPADVGEEPVAFVLRSDVEKFDVDAGEIVDVRFFPRGTLRPDNQEPLYSATALERVVRERDEALETVDGLSLADGAEQLKPDELREMANNAVAECFGLKADLASAEAKLAEARKVIEPFADFIAQSDASIAARLRQTNEPTEMTDAELAEFADPSSTIRMTTGEMAFGHAGPRTTHLAVTVGDLRAARRWIEETK